MKPICLIPARSGSKGLKNKNMLFLDFKPLIFHTIDAAIQSECFDTNDIYVSTDSKLYKKICEEKGVKVLLRDEALSRDTTTTFEVNKDFLNLFDNDQVFVLLQPTSPFRNYEDIQNAFKLYKNNDCDNVVSFTKSDKSLKLFTKMSDSGFIIDNIGIDKGYRRQSKEDIYYPNGAIFISKKSVYLKNESYFTDRTLMYIMDKKSSIDVDDKEDFINCLGTIFFDYKKREIDNKQSYREMYISLDKNRKFENIILGDSRILNLNAPMYENFSLGGVTLSTALENLDLILRKDIKKIIISLGINDLISGHSLNIIEENFKKIINILLNKKIDIILTTIVYTLFRESVSNEDIKVLNDFIFEFSKEKNIKIIDLNKKISKNCYLKYSYTYDGLHFNKEGQRIINDRILKNI